MKRSAMLDDVVCAVVILVCFTTALAIVACCAIVEHL